MWLKIIIKKPQSIDQDVPIIMEYKKSTPCMEKPHNTSFVLQIIMFS